MNHIKLTRWGRVILAALVSLVVSGLLAQGLVPAPLTWAGELAPADSREKTAGASISFSKTVGTLADECATTHTVTVPPNAPVTFCYQVTNTGDVTFTQHTVVDNKLGPIFGGAQLLPPGDSFFITKTATLTQTTTNTAIWTASDGGSNTAFNADSATVTIAPPKIVLTKTVGVNPHVCATSQRIIVQPDTLVTYCYKVTNTGLFTLTTHSLVDNQLGALFDGSHNLAPGASFFLTQTVAITQTTVNTATWTAMDAYSNTTQAASSATVTIYTVPPQAQTRSPDMDAIITQKGSLTVRGIAWTEGVTPPYLVDAPTLTVQRVSDRMYYVGWTAVISAEYYILQEAKKPDFSDQTTTVIPAPTTNQLISKSAGNDGTYYYRVQATRFELAPSRWSNVKSVVVPWPALVGAAQWLEQPAQLTNNVPVTVEVRMKPVGGGSADWHPATLMTATTWGGWDWSYAWSLPEERATRYTIEARATDEAGNTGPVDTITVTLDNKFYLVYLPTVMRRWPPVPYAPALTLSSPPDANGNYTFIWTYSGSSPVITYTLQEATDADFTANLRYYYPGANMSQAITGKMPGVYYYRVWGTNAYGAGESSNVVMVTVYPGAPVLNAINNPNQLGSYTISWSAGRGATAYTLEEAPTSSFTSTTALTTTSRLSYTVTNKASGTYYYRARSVSGSLTSAWSNVVSTTVVGGFIDYFDDPNSGWPTYDRSVFEAKYASGEYKIKIKLDTFGNNNYTMAIMKGPYVNPYTNYDVTVKHRFNESSDQGGIEPTLGKAGILFAGNSDYSDVFVFEWNFEGSWAVFRYQGLTYPTDWAFPIGKVKDLQWWTQNSAIKAGYKSNIFVVKVRGNNVEFWANGTRLGTLVIDTLPGKTQRSGLSTGSWERTPVDSRFDFFYLEPR